MAVVKSIKNKKFKREWVRNLRHIIRLRNKFFKFNPLKVKKLRYYHTKLHVFSKIEIKKKFSVLYYL